MHPSKYLFDHNHVRYQLVKSNPGKPYNWLFVPGGPGGDSSYFLTLVVDLDIPGNIWLIDFPANGSNFSEQVKPDYDFEKWEGCLRGLVAQFENPIYVGHSFGGMFPLLFPELEEAFQGLVLLNSAPTLWLEEAAMMAVKKGLPLLTEGMKAFVDNPNRATFKEALLACLPYYFHQESMDRGRQILEELPFNYHAAVWWLRKSQEINYNAKWIPEKLPTLILGASEDCITPFSIFERDSRFNRDNILLRKIEQAGHFPWLEQKDVVKSLFKEYVDEYVETGAKACGIFATEASKVPSR